MGGPSGWRGNQRNAVWRHFLGPGTRARHTPQSLRAFETALIADLRAAAGCYPADQQLRQLITELRANSDRFAKLWDSGVVGRHEAARKTALGAGFGRVDHDAQVAARHSEHVAVQRQGADVWMIDADRLALLTVLGTQALVG